jgi:hypothetical protein
MGKQIKLAQDYWFDYLLNEMVAILCGNLPLCPLKRSKR